MKNIGKITLLGLAAATLLPATGIDTARAQGIESLSTGISRSERVVAHPEYPLKLVFAEKETGSLVAGVTVAIVSGGKEVFQTTDAGPWLFVKLPAGDYLVEASRKSGVKCRKKVTVAATGQTTAQLSWPKE